MISRLLGSLMDGGTRAPASKIEAFVETPFKVGGKTIRPDGLIGVTRGGRTWWALVECKIADRALTSEQMES